MSAPTFGSLFSGIGGLDLGLERAGWTCAFQVENDSYCQRVLAKHWPTVPRWGDIREVNADDLPAVDLLAGGFPCQDVSVAGRRAGLAGARSGLFHEFMRLVAALAPAWVCIENVPGLLSSHHGRDMGTVLGALGQLGYGYAYRVLDAQYFGVAQRRRRVFIVGSARPAGAAAVLFEPESGSGHPAPRRQKGARVAASLTAGAHRPGVNEPGRHHEDDVNLVYCIQNGARPREYSQGLGVSESLAYTLDTFGEHAVAHALTAHGQRQDATVEDCVVAHALNDPHGCTEDGTGRGTPLVAHTLRAEGADASEDGTGRGVPLVLAFDTTQVTSDKNYSQPREGDPCHPLAAGAHPPAIAFDWQSGGDVRLNCSETHTSALQASQTPPVSGSVVRRLTPVECARLQGFPDDWLAGETDSAQYRMLGNAVCVPVAEWIGRRLLEHAHTGTGKPYERQWG